MNETPKKVIDGGEKCFLCSESAISNNKIFVFGKSALDIAYLIKESTTVDVNNYSESDNLFVRKNMCYKRLLRLKGALDKCKGIKAEIKERFVPPKTKRLQRSDTQHEDATRFSPVQRPHCKASKSIDFAGASNTTNPVVFATSSHEIYQGMQQSLPPSHNPCPLYSFHRPDVCRPIYPFPTASILNRGGSTSINDSVLQLKLPIPIMNSSPVASKTKSTRDVYTQPAVQGVSI